MAEMSALERDKWLSVVRLNHAVATLDLRSAASNCGGNYVLRLRVARKSHFCVTSAIINDLA